MEGGEGSGGCKVGNHLWSPGAFLMGGYSSQVSGLQDMDSSGFALGKNSFAMCYF
jgi:hypothetical protein